MTSIKSRAVAGTRSSSRAKSKTRSLIRAGLLGSTALVAVSLAATGAMAQTTVVPSPGTVAAGTTTISSGTTLQLNINSGVNYLTGTIFTGAGTLQTNASGTGTYGFRGQMNLLAGGLLDINTGTFNGSADGLAVWTSNLGGLNINAGARFDGVEGAIFVDALTGSGRLEGGFGGARTTTVGVNGGSGTFTGTVANNTDFGGRVLALTKAGAGTQSLLGTNSYTGITTVSGGVLALGGTSTMTGDIYVNGGVLRALNTTAFGSGTIHMINPTVEFGAAGTYANNFSLEVVNGQQAADPTTLTNTSGGTVTLSGRIYETAGVGGANQYVTFAGANTTVLGNATNSWGGVTTVNSGVTLQGTTASISGGSIVNSGTLIYTNTSAGTANQNISGSGALQVTGVGGVTLNGAITSTGQISVSGVGSSLTLGGARSGGATTGVVVNGVGATLIVADGASIQSGQYNGVRMTGAGSTLTNLGTIQNIGRGADGAVGAGVHVQNAGAGGVTTVTNGSLTDTGAGSIIRGSSMGVRHEVGSTDTLVVNNHGHIVGDSNSGIESWASGGLTVNNFSAGYIYGNGFGIYSASPSANSVTNAGVIGQNVDGSRIVYFAGVSTTGALTLTNQTGGLIIGQLSGVESRGTLGGSNAGTLRGTDGHGLIVTAGGSFTNSVGGQIIGSQRGISLTGGTLTLTNAGSITGGTNDGITALGALTLTNTGTISSTAFSGVAFTGVSTVTNSGTITGGNSGTWGYGVQNAGASGTSFITNQSGGLISGGTGSILLNGAGNTIIDLQAGSTTTGQILSNAGGTHTVTIAGALNGAYNAATGSGIDILTLTSTGSITGAVTLGAGDDTFNWQGGTFASIDAGSGANDVFNSALGAGVSGSLNLSNLSNFDSYNHQSGNLTLTGSRTTGPGWNLVPGSSLTLDGSLTVTSGTQHGITMNGNGSPATVSILTGATLNAYRGVWFNTGAANNFSNAGTVTGSNTGLFTNGALTATNTGTITAGTDAAFGTGISVSTMTNSGILTGGSNAATGFGVLSEYAGVTVTNNAGTISGGAGGISSGSLQGATNYGGLLSVTNAAGAQISGAVAIITGGTSSLTLNNSGRVLGGATGAIVANGSGAVSITNNAGGQIVSSGGNAISTIGTATITNAGLIGNGTVDGGGVYTAGGTGYAINIAGGTITNSGTIRGASAGIYSSNGLTLTNTGTITGGQGGTSQWRDGVSSINAPSTILNAGTISAPTYSAIVIQGGSITNAAGGTLTGGLDSVFGAAVQFSATGGTFTNYGTATGTGAGAVRVNTVGAETTINLHAGSTTGAILLESGNDTLAIYNGRGTDSLATVDGTSGITLQAAGTLAAASFGAINMGGGTNTLTLRGTGDGTAANGAAGTMATGSVTGLSNLSKIDSGTWTLTGAGNYAGTTTVSGGTLRVLNTGNSLGNGAVSIATGATLNFDNQTGGLMSIKGDIFTGTGRILFTGNTGSITALGNGGNGTVHISLSQGGLIDVQSGTVDGSSYVQGFWTDNMGSLNIASGAHFDTVEGLVRVDALTGAGTLSGGYGGTVPITLGVAGGTGSFSGTISNGADVLALTKVGAGTQTLTGTNTYTGQTSIEGGTLEVRNGSAIADTGVVSVSSGATFLVSNAETIGRLTGAGAVNLAGGSLTLANSSGTYSGAMSGVGGLVVSGGSLTLGGALTQAGGTTVSNGAYVNLFGSASNDGTAFTINDASTLDVRSGATVSSGSYSTVVVGGALSWVSNEGSINNVSASGDGIGAAILSQTGADSGTNIVVNQAGASLTGAFNGIYNNNAAGTTLTMNNSGAIDGVNFYGIQSVTSGNTNVSNYDGGSITGQFGGVAGQGAIYVSNQGSIGSTSGSGIQSYSGSLDVYNHTTGVVSGGSFGINAGNAGAFIYNTGTISSVGGTGVNSSGSLTLLNLAGGAISGRGGVYAAGVGTVTNDAGASITAGSLNNTVRLAGNGSSLTNAGTISGTTNYAGVFFDGTGTVTNQAGGLISNTSTAVQLAGNGSSLINAGTITSNSSYSGVYFDGTGTVTNQAGGAISNTGTAVRFAGAGSALDNAGSISNTTNSSAVYFANTGTVVNRADGTITSANARAVRMAGVDASVTNAGLIAGGDTGVFLEGANGSVTNTGTIRITGGSANDIISGVYSSATGTTVTNSGTIESSLTDGRGVYLAGGTGTITNQSGGTISGNGTGAAILLTGAGYTLDLQAGSTVNGQIDASATTGLNTVTLAGALNGGYAGGSGSDVVTLVGGATFGALLGADGTDTLILGGMADSALDIGQTVGFESRTLNGGAVWTLSGADSDAADWTLDSGTLRLTGGLSVHDAAGVRVNSGATLSVGASEAIGALNGAGAVTIDANRTLWVGTNNADSLFSGVISGAGGLSQTGSGTLTLSGTNTYTGDTRVDAGMLRLGASNVIADASRLIVQTGAILDLNGFNETVAVTYLNGTIQGAGMLTSADLFLNGATVNANLGAGRLGNAAGTSILNATSNAGQVTVYAGTLRLGASDRLADTASLTVFGGSTLDLQGFNDTVGVAYLNGTLQGSGTLTAADQFLNGAVINANLGAGFLANAGGVSTLNGTSAAGTVSVLAGTLRLGASERLANTASLSVSSGATLDLQGHDETVAVAWLNGTVNGQPVPFAPQPNFDAKGVDGPLTLPVPTGTGTLTAAEYQLNGATINANLGTGNLFNTGGVSTLNGTAAAGLVSVQAGTLRLGQAERLADTATLSVSSGATLDLQGHDETVAMALLNGTLNSTVSLPSPEADQAQVIPALSVSTKGTDGPLTTPAPTGTGTLTAAEYRLNGATINANLGTGILFNLGGLRFSTEPPQPRRSASMRAPWSWGHPIA